MIAGGVEDFLWVEATKTAVYLINRSPMRSNFGLTPDEVFYGVKPNLQHLIIFGCQVYVHVPESQRNKLQPRAIEGRFVGYDDSSSKAFRFYMPPSNKVIVTRDVVFNESLKRNQGENFVSSQDDSTVQTSSLSTLEPESSNEVSSNQITPSTQICQPNSPSVYVSLPHVQTPLNSSRSPISFPSSPSDPYYFSDNSVKNSPVLNISSPDRTHDLDHWPTDDAVHDISTSQSSDLQWDLPKENDPNQSGSQVEHRSLSKRKTSLPV